jgi:hypothetical protein
MKTRILLPAIAALAIAGTAAAGGKPEPKTSVVLAKSWEAAIEEAKALNVPVVVHNHGMFCGPCWGMHDGVMCGKKYIDFAAENTVEVIALSSFQEGVDKKDKHAETYDAKVNGETVKFLVEFPGLTADQVLALGSSKAGTYNKTGGVPYTALIDPHTEEEITKWSGSQSANTIMDAVTEAKKTLQKAHGKGIARKDLKAVGDAEASAAAKMAKLDFAGAYADLAKAAPKAEKADALKARLKVARDAVHAAAEAALTKIGDAKEADPAAAKKDLAALVSKLVGADLADLQGKAKEMLAGM